MVRTEQPVWSLKQNRFLSRTMQKAPSFFHARKEVKLVNDLAYRTALQEEIRRKFYGHDTLKSKHTPQYAMSAERQYSQTFANLYRRFDKIVLRWLPKILKAIEKEQNQNLRTDDAVGLMQLIDLYLTKMMNDLKTEEEQEKDGSDLEEQLKTAAYLVRSAVNRGWSKAVERTLGVKILSGYYDETFYKELLEQWFRENMGMISSIPQELVQQIRDTLWEDITQNTATDQMVKHIQHTCQVSENRAKFIARDQVGKLQAQLTRQQQTDAGVREYIWSSKRDSKVRHQHRKLNGNKFSWDSPPLSDPRTGRHCHPGEDYGCRCTAIPVFPRNVVVPYEKKE